MVIKNDLLSTPISFSIIMESYNSAEFIEVAIKSVISQTYPNWELIIVDDCSPDNANEIIRPFLKDKRIKLLVHKTNKGGGYADRNAIMKASNEIIGLLDPDDKLHENALEVMAKAYKEYPEYGLIYSTHWVCDSKLENPQISKEVGDTVPNQSNLINNKVSHFRTFRKDAYKKTKGINAKLRFADDFDLIYKLEEVTTLKFINKPLYYYRYHKGGVTKKFKFEVQLDRYVAQLNAYYRRLNKDIPNVKLSDLFIDYYQITFYKIINSLIYLGKNFKIVVIIKNFSNKSFYIYKILKKQFQRKRLKRKNFFLLESILAYIIKKSI